MTSRCSYYFIYIYIYNTHEDLIPFSYTCTIFLSKPMVCIFMFNMPLVWLFISTKYLFSKSCCSPQDIKWLSHYLFFQTGEEHKICLSSELKPRMYTKMGECLRPVYILIFPPERSVYTHFSP